MKKSLSIAVAMLTWAPLLALAQDAEEEDEFYRDVDDAGGEADEGGAASSADVALEAEAEAGSRSRFRNSLFIYENVFSARPRSTDLSADATFYYAMSYTLSPRFYVNDWMHLRARFAVEQELTNSDSSTYLYEPLASDTSIEARFTDVLESVTDFVDLGALVRLTFPSSKASQARTLFLGTSAGLSLSREFEVLEGLGFSYSFDVTKYWNRYTTATQEAPSLSCTPGAVFECDAQINMGTRNPSWLFRNMFGLTFSPIENLTLAVNVLWYTYQLYGLTDADCTDLYGGVVSADPTGCPIEAGETNTDMRVAIWYVVDLSYQVLPWLGLAIGTSTFNPQLTPDSEYRAPFFNRYTNFYFDISINADELIRTIANRRSTRRGTDEV